MRWLGFHEKFYHIIVTTFPFYIVPISLRDTIFTTYILYANFLGVLNNINMLYFEIILNSAQYKKNILSTDFFGSVFSIKKLKVKKNLRTIAASVEWPPYALVPAMCVEGLLHSRPPPSSRDQNSEAAVLSVFSTAPSSLQQLPPGTAALH